MSQDSSSLRPHRGTLILILGILGLVICMPCGIASWVMGNTDLAAMQRGEMDRAGEGMTKAGKICGMISVILAIVFIIIYVLAAVVFVAAHNAGK